MDDLRRLLNELEGHANPQTAEVARAARSLQDGLSRLEQLVDARRRASQPAARGGWLRLLRTTHHGLRLAAAALRTDWEDERR